jgi:alpha-mannosidase
MLIVHMIGNAHIDPVWLWRWPAGVVEVLSTCRTACDLLDEDPELVFTRSDVWVYERVEETDPVLYERIRRHVKAGRWAVVGGWYVQPDCNLPREESFRRHIGSGRRYFGEKFGQRVTVGYNVDSFGHAASLPRILAEEGYDSYVMMRPMQHEKALPASLFRWRSTAESGEIREVLTWRIPQGYCISAADLSEHVRAAVAGAAPGVDHVMCFYGVGDHGGGPTREQVAWIHAHRDAFPGARLEFSHPRAFFDAVKPSASKLPVVTGELQMHAIGCYSVGRRLKKAAREAEHGLIMAERSLEAIGADPGPRERDALEGAWERLMFNQFHDTYGATIVPAAYDDALAQLGGARDAALQVLYRSLLRHAVTLSPEPRQRIVALNASDADFDGFIEWEPWLGDWRPFGGWLADPEGRPVPWQLLASPSLTSMPGALLWPARLAPGEIGSWEIRPGAAPSLPPADLSSTNRSVSNRHWRIAAGEGPNLFLADRSFAGALRLDVLEDGSDTWSHGIDRYAGPSRGTFEVTGCRLEETGPVRASLRVEAGFGRSTALVHARLYREDGRLELEIDVDWRESLSVLKLVVPLLMRDERLDGIPGGAVLRAQDGRETPIIDWTLVTLSDGGTVGIAMPDCSALDGTLHALRLTLLRSPAYAWHDPARLPADRPVRWIDQGEHTFRFVFLRGADSRGANAAALAKHRPPVCIDWTTGMR